MVSTICKPKLAEDLLTLLTMNTLEERLRAALKDAQLRSPSEKINQAWLHRRVGVSTAAIAKWFNGQTQKLEGENLLKASDALGVNPEWLATGKGGMNVEHYLPKSVHDEMHKQLEEMASVDILLALLSSKLKDEDEETRKYFFSMLNKYVTEESPDEKTVKRIKDILE